MLTEQLLPHNIEAEEAVIGSLLIDSDSFLDISHLISPDDFYRDRNRLCFAACAELFRRGEAIDQITVARELHRTDNLESAGGMAYLSHLVTTTPTSSHAGFYAQVVYNTSTMRRLIEAGSNISAIGYRDTADVETTLRQAEDLIFDIRGSRLKGGFVPLRDIYDQFLEERNAAILPTSNSAPITSGYADLDTLLGGMQKSDMLVLGARPGIGKSALAVNVSVNAAKQGYSVGIFSLEMSKEQLALRILSSEAEVEPHRIRLQLTTEEQEQRITSSVGVLSELNILIDDTPFQTIAQMRGEARRQTFKSEGLDLLVVDYLQLIQGPGRSRGGENRVQEISEISRSIKGIARELNVPIITCSQLSRVVEGRPGHRPMLSDLRDSGSIEQDADIVMFIYREDVYYTEDDWEQHFPDRPYPRNIAEIIVAKHRHGPTGGVKLRFRNNLVRFDALGRDDDF